MTKLSLFLLHLPALFHCGTDAKPLIYRPNRHVQRAFNPVCGKAQIDQINRQIQPRVIAIRGGDLGSIKAETLAKTFSFLTSMDALTGIFLPVTACSWFGIDLEKGSVGQLFCEVCGAHAAGLTVASYLATTKKTSIEKAIAYGNIARLAILTKILIANRFNKLGIDDTNIFLFSSVLMFVTYTLLSEKWNPMFWANTMALIMGVIGAMIVIDPVAHVKRVANFDLETENKSSQEMARFAGMYVILSALHTGLIGHKIDPVKAVGFTSLAITPFMYYAQQIHFERFLGISKEFWMFLVIVILGAISAGTLL